MGKTIRANAKLDDRKVASILAELQRWGNGEFGRGLTWRHIEECSGYTRQALSRHPPILRAYQTAKLALDKPKRRSYTRSTSDEILYLDQTIRSLREQLSHYEAVERTWIERWQRIAYHCTRRGLDIEELDSPIDEQRRR